MESRSGKPDASKIAGGARDWNLVNEADAKSGIFAEGIHASNSTPWSKIAVENVELVDA